MWHRRVRPFLSTQLSAGAGLLRATPGLRTLLGGSLATWVITLVLHPHGFALVGVRVILATPIILLFLARTGEVGRLRRDVQRLRALLGSAPPWRETVSRPRRLLLICLCVMLRAPRQPWVETTDHDETACRQGHSEFEEEEVCAHALVARNVEEHAAMAVVRLQGSADHTGPLELGKGNGDEPRRR